MKIATLTSLFVLMSVVSMIAIAPSAFADHSTATVTNAPGSATPGCEDTNECFIPNPVTIAMGGTVTWDNTDTAAHTATAGTAADGPSGVFDSSLIMAGASFSFTFDAAGIFDYFCMVHPWMAGTVIVEDTQNIILERGQTAEVLLQFNIPNVLLGEGEVSASLNKSSTASSSDLIITSEHTDLNSLVGDSQSYLIQITAGEDALSGTHKVLLGAFDGEIAVSKFITVTIV